MPNIIKADLANTALPTGPLIKPFDRQLMVADAAAGDTHEYLFGPIIAPNGATQATFWPILEAGTGTVTIRLRVELLDRNAAGDYVPYTTPKYVQIPDSPVAAFRDVVTTDTAVIPIVLAGPPHFFRISATALPSGAGADDATFTLLVRFEGHIGNRG